MIEIKPGTTLKRTRRIEGSATELWGDTVRFTALVDSVQGDYIEATVTRSNRHYRSPEFGSSLALSRENLIGSDKWAIE